MDNFDAIMSQITREMQSAIDDQVRAAIEVWSGKPAEEALKPESGLNPFAVTITGAGCGYLTVSTTPSLPPHEILRWDTEITEESVKTTFNGPFVKDSK